ncbi:TetR/AcrR family transcriptional regulator C-terminal ligand-binding domain-containing protein [Streptomyces sp. JH34]|uniref:TetR/AcrR family transcriptional regulator C-terminal ligand-binding domain-containing protein n=1 Tax=Streptomyces sp. JH34 TaxID=2793633 RepID=UPI0023F73A09|nr:TetR/AcrR family transcriptional regulator C-terminal ligand-binding domain-containing protein [Streptomyces sp. JH34]MDF6021495.1 TetR/AcrR family transcriptional regulator C-terminal ligand-binding domain-containing protein [Streptomyces sp. JH34]
MDGVPEHRHRAPPRRMTAAVRRAVDAGELRDDLDVDLMDDLFLGPMFVRTVHRPETALPEDLVYRVIRTSSRASRHARGMRGTRSRNRRLLPRERSVTSLTTATRTGTRHAASVVLMAERPSSTARTASPIA